MVALISAVGAVVAAVISSLLASDGGPSTGRTTTSNPPPPIEYQGTAILRGANPEIDLDSLPDGTDGDHVGDLIHTGMALTTSKNSLIALLDRAQQPTPDVCRTALTNGTHRIAVSQLETGLSLCIRTTAGRTGAITLDLVRTYGEPVLLGQVALSYRIWNLPAN